MAAELVRHPVPRGPGRLVAAGLHDVVAAVRSGATGGEVSEVGLKEAAVLAVTEGVSLLEVMTAAERWCAAAIAAAWRDADPDGFAAVAAAADAVAKAQVRASRTFAAAWFAHSPTPPHTVVASAFLNAQTPDLLASAARVPLPRGRFLLTAAPVRGDVGQVVTAMGADTTLWCLDGSDLVVMLPLPDRKRTAALDALRRVLHRVRTLLRGSAVAVAGQAAHPRRALLRSRELRPLVADLPGLVHDEDLLLVDSTAAADPVAADGLVSLLDPIRHLPELVDSLRAVYAADLHRGSAARALGVHRQTIAHRMNRITSATGLDPLSTRGVLLFSVALALTGRQSAREAG
ncbi:helix-turn-helix domain-containing protein [Actinokineospora sp. 24-640]